VTLRWLRAARVALALVALGLPSRARAEGLALPPSPYRILDPSLLEPGFLDAVPLCVAQGLDPQLAEPIRLLRDKKVAIARKLIAPMLTAPEGLVDPALHLSAAVVNARAAESASQRNDALHLLNLQLARGGPAALRACANLERARLQLLQGLGPEASASTRLVLRASEGLEQGASFAEAARFYRAEAYVQAHRGAEALPLYQQLSGSASPELAYAAALRLADARVASLPADEAWHAMADLLNQPHHEQLDLSGFAPRASSLAVRAGDEKAGLRWISLAAALTPDRRAAAIASLRKADLLLESGLDEDARDLYEQVAGSHAARDVRALAQLRLAAFELVPEDAAKRMDRLRYAEATPQPSVALMARDEIARRLLDAGKLSDSLTLLLRIGHDRPQPELIPHFSETFNRALAKAVEGKGQAACLAMVQRLGGRDAVLLRNARDPDPLIRLGDCLTSLGLPGAAQKLFRGIARRFGPEDAARLILRLAKVNLALGDFAAVHATLKSLRSKQRDNAAAPQEEVAWQRIRGELARREGRLAHASAIWLDLLRGGHADAVTALRVARAAMQGEAPKATAETLRTLVLAQGPSPSPLWAETGLVVADLIRARSPEQARLLYQRAADNLPEGSQRARAAFFAARLETQSDAWRVALAQARATDSQSAWSRLAAVEIEAARLRLAVGRKERAPQ